MANRYHARITSSGYVYILITVVISVAAVNTGNNLLYLISSIMLALMFISGLSSLEVALEKREWMWRSAMNFMALKRHHPGNRVNHQRCSLKGPQSVYRTILEKGL